MGLYSAARGRHGMLANTAYDMFVIKGHGLFLPLLQR